MVDPRNMTTRQLPYNRRAFRRIQGRLSRYVGSKGGKAFHTEALLLSISRETGGSFDPKQREVGQPRGKGGFGILQWTAARADTFVAWAKARGLDAAELNVQLTYLVLELNHDPQTFDNGRPHGWTTSPSRFWAAKNLQEALSLLTSFFIRPAFSNRRVSGNSVSTVYRLALEGGARNMPANWKNEKEDETGDDAPYVVASSPTPAPLAGRVSTTTIVKTKATTAPALARNKQLVRFLQTMLNITRSAGLKVDGLWGPKTERASLAYYGNVTPQEILDRAAQTLEYFKHPNISYAGGSVSSARPAITTLQRLLNSVFKLKLAVDGIWGPKTAAALRRNVTNMTAEQAVRHVVATSGKF